MSGLILMRPLWLLALLPLLVLAVWIRRRRLAGAWAGVIDPALLPALRKLGLLTEARGSVMAFLPLMAAGVLAVAMSGPALLLPGTTEFRTLDPMILVLDLSPSVVADQRALNDLKAGAATLVALAEGRPVGMMVYSAEAFLASASTSDGANLQGLIAVLDAETMPLPGSRPDIALSMARDLFGGAAGEGPGLGGADLVVISDGGGTGPRAVEEAARLANDGTRVWALTLPGAAAGAPAADAAAMASLAEAGGGEALPVADAKLLIDRIEGARTAQLIREDSGALSHHDLGPWLLPLAMLTLFPLFRRRR